MDDCQGANAQQIKTVVVIAMENHNWTQPANQFSGPIQQVFQNPNAPLQQLFADLAADSVADYHWISPNQYNDMHTSLTGGDNGLTGDAANIKQGDDFLRQIIPVIMASEA